MTTHALPAPAKGLHHGLWTVQLLLAAAFGAAGAMKATAPIAELGQNMPWVNDVPAAMVRFVGVSELLGAVGLVAPLATGIKPRLTALAAAGLVVVMALAAAFHASRGEYAGIGINAVLGGLAAFVAWGRARA